MTSHEPPRHAGDAFEVFDRGTDNRDTRVRIVVPIDRDLEDAQPVVLGEQQQFGVEEPCVVLDRGYEPPSDVGADGLEPTLRVAQAGGEHRPQDQVVRLRDELASRSPSHVGARREAATDREVRVTGHQRCDEGKQRVEAGRQVDIHVRDHRSVARHPRSAQCQTSPFSIEVNDADPRQLGRQSFGHRERGVTRRVVRDGHPPGEGKSGREIHVQPADARLEHLRLVVDRNHHLDRRARGCPSAGEGRGRVRRSDSSDRLHEAR